MKLLFLRTDFYGAIRVGGSFSHIRGFLKGMDELGVGVETSSSAELFVGNPYPFHQIPYSPFFDSFPEAHCLAHNRTLEQNLPAIIEQTKPDFLYQRHSEFIYATSKIAEKFGLPLILEVNNIEAWLKKNWGGKLYFKNFLRRAEALQFHKADALMVVSEVLKQDLIRWFDLPEEKIHVNPNGVDVDAFSDRIDTAAFFQTLSDELKKRWRGKLLCGFVGTFGEWHGVEVLAKSVKRVVAKNPSIHFVLIGGGKLRKTVDEILETDGVSDYVTLLGSVSHELVPKYLSLCDVLLSPHVDNVDGTPFFGSPTKLFEYMGLGKAIVASGVGQIKDILRDGENGLLIPPKDENALAERILFLGENPDLRNALGKAARKDAVEKYSWRENARRVLQIAESLNKNEKR
ncbi:glycosyl transferase group 1 [Chloroherpeton thalassium ATCC 35110]|uniref:Glycosyl transferase group 1 n=1 Tax=Chloroherpeton thalassium (strain ATCC 35110 / GB-78) TaxID=517418 RepID=B3QUW8_CHLT3|nr:glycosyltransferase family 4 protein [Chloroherpeton thalassium]ACF14469.1 glycosyl transferase group 1 [Chloroherpeton thalassium ATCC 35110]